MFTKKGMTVLDPFVGSGTTLIACNELGRNGIGIDLNPEYERLFRNRLTEKGKVISTDIKYLVGNSFDLLSEVGEVDYIVTSPPYLIYYATIQKALETIVESNTECRPEMLLSFIVISKTILETMMIITCF